MWFTKDSTGFKGWFVVVDNTGILRTGLVAGDFVVTIVNPADTSSQVVTVSQSSVKPGLYKFSIPSSFLLANGIGEYSITVEINTITGPSGAPNVRTSFGVVLHVSYKDFNDIVDASQINNIETVVNNIDSKVDDIKLNLDLLVKATISDQFVVSTGSTSTNIVTNATNSDDTFNGQLGVFISYAGTNPIIVARVITDYNEINGEFIVDALPFTPSNGDELIVVSRTATAVVDNNAIANAVWTIATSPTTVGSYGELVNIVSSQTVLIPGLI